MNQNVSGYTAARVHLVANPGIGKKRLSLLVGVKTPSARRFIERFRGETQGHSTDPEYLLVKGVKDKYPEWGAKRVLSELVPSGITLDKVKLHLARWVGATTPQPAAQQSTQPPPKPAELTATAVHPQQGGELRRSESQTAMDLCYLGPSIHTLEDLLVYAKVETTVWEVERWTANKWEVGARTPTGIATCPLFQVKAWLKKREEEMLIKNVMGSVLTQFKAAAPVRPSRPRKPSAKGILEVSIMDLHLGKSCWAPEVGESYNLEIAMKQFHSAIDDLLAKSASFEPEMVILPVGNDFFNVDNLNNTTTKGTPQHEVGRWQESFVLGRRLIVEAVDTLLEVAPVHVVMVSGNHDLQRVYYLGDALSCWYSRSDDVKVDNAPTLRKYIHYGKNLLGFTHGSEEAPSINLPLVMAHEQPQAWAQSKYREWHVGHWHSRRRKAFVPLEDKQGIIVRVIPSLTPPDSWHKSRGYSGVRAAEAFFWDHDAGCVAEFVHAL